MIMSEDIDVQSKKTFYSICCTPEKDQFELKCYVLLSIKSSLIRSCDLSLTFYN